MFGGSNYSCTVRSSAVATNSFVNGTSFSADMATQLVLNVSVTLGSATNAMVKVLYSQNNAAPWFTESFVDNASGTASSSQWNANVYERVYVFTANGSYAVPVPVKAKYFTAATLVTGNTTNSLIQVLANVGVV